MSAKFNAVTAQELVGCFVDFAFGCGYHEDSLAEAFDKLNRCASDDV
jgi:hypothetical protein